MGSGLWMLVIVLGWHDPLYGLLVLVGLFLVICFHEAGHWLAARFVHVRSADLATRIGAGPGVSIFSGRLRLGILPGQVEWTFPVLEACDARRLWPLPLPAQSAASLAAWSWSSFPRSSSTSPS